MNTYATNSVMIQSATMPIRFRMIVFYAALMQIRSSLCQRSVRTIARPPPMPDSSPMRSRTTLIVALLGASFLVTAFIAVRALTTAVYQRTTAERVIRDFATLAADEFARGADAQISYYGCYPLAQKISAGVPVPQSPLVRKAFRIDTRGGANTDVPPPLQPLIAGALRDRTNVVRVADTTYYIGVADRGELPPVIGGLELEPQRFPFF